jgi:hypothetical protein
MQRCQLSLDLPLFLPGPEVSPASDWCQRWRDGTARWKHRSEGGFEPRSYEVGPLDDRTAKAYVERHHYSRTYVASRLRYGLWERGGTLVGVAVLSVPVRATVLTCPFPELVPYTESLELGRFVLADRVPGNGETWFLARVFRLAAREGIRGVVSFSDPVARCDAAGKVTFPGHAGGIYHNIRILARSTLSLVRAMVRHCRPDRYLVGSVRRAPALGSPARRSVPGATRGRA